MKQREQGWGGTALSWLPLTLGAGQGRAVTARGSRALAYTAAALDCQQSCLKMKKNKNLPSSTSKWDKENRLYLQKCKWDPFTLGKNHLEMCQRSQCRTFKLLEETKGNFQDTIMGNDFLNRIPETNKWQRDLRNGISSNQSQCSTQPREQRSEEITYGLRQNLCWDSGEVNSYSIRIKTVSKEWNPMDKWAH